MKNFNNWAYKIDCNHTFYTQAHFHLILVYDNLYTFVEFFREGFQDQFYIKPAHNKISFLTLLSFLYIIKIINLDDITNENNKEYNEKWPYIPDYPYRILIIRGSGSGKRNALLNVINKQNVCNYQKS